MFSTEEKGVGSLDYWDFDWIFLATLFEYYYGYSSERYLNLSQVKYQDWQGENNVKEQRVMAGNRMILH